MALLTNDFLKSRANARRWRRFVLPVVAVLILGGGAAAGVFYLLKNHKVNSSLAYNGACDHNSGRIPAPWLLKYFHTCNENDQRVGGPDGDPDGDILTNVQEYYFGTDPTKADTDGDGASDGEEVAFGQNPSGAGSLQVPVAAEDYIKQLGPDYQDFTKENIQKQVEQLFNPKQPVLLAVPDDKDLNISAQSDVPAMEKYFNDTKDLFSSEDADKQKVETDLFTMSAAELDAYVAKLEATKKVLLATPVPSGIVNIQKLKVAQVNAGIRMIELVRDNYRADQDNKQFWQDFFNQMVATQEASQLELLAWGELGKELQDKGGIPNE